MISPLEKQEVDEKSDAGLAAGDLELYERLSALGAGFANLAGEFNRILPEICVKPGLTHLPSAFASLGRLNRTNGDQLGRAARQIYRSRRARDVTMPADLFGEPAWDLLLDLYASHCEGRQISVTFACIASSVPATTALRWIAILVDAGLVARTEDSADRRRAFVELTPKGRSTMAEYLQRYLGV